MAQAQQEAMAAAWEAKRLRAPDATPMDHPVCASCGTGIPLLRRRVLPGVERCVACQEAWEAEPR